MKPKIRVYDFIEKIPKSTLSNDESKCYFCTELFLLLRDNRNGKGQYICSTEGYQL